jgi:transposase
MPPSQRPKKGLAVGSTRRGKGTKILAICTDHSLPLAVSIQSALPHESQLVEEVLGQSFLDELPERAIGDAAYDSDPLDDYLLETYDIELIAPHKLNRKRLAQDGRAFRRYRRRWCVERLFAWLHWFRRLVIRWEYHAENFLAIILQSLNCPTCNMYSCAAAMAGAGFCSEVRTRGGMMRITLNIVASLLVLAGVIWFLQGINVLPGSFMTGQTRWAVYGAIRFALARSPTGLTLNYAKLITPNGSPMQPVEAGVIGDQFEE